MFFVTTVRREEAKEQMYTSLDQVIARWAERYAEKQRQHDSLPMPGLTHEQIQILESQLGLKLHPAAVEVLCAVNLDTIDFRTVHFGVGLNLLKYLYSWNDGTYDHRAVDDGLVNIGGSGRYTFFLENETGYVYAWDMYDDDGLLIADNLTQFILRAASIDEVDWPDWETESEQERLIEQANRYFDENDLQQGRPFWLHMILGTL